MKILSIISLSAMAIPMVASLASCAVSNKPVVNYRMTRFEANEDLDLISNTNLQLKKLMNLENGEFNAKKLNNDFAINGLFPNHKLYQFFFRDTTQPEQQGIKWREKLIQNHEINFLNNDFVSHLKKSDSGFYFLPILETSEEIEGEPFANTTLTNLRKHKCYVDVAGGVKESDILTGMSQEPKATNQDVMWTYGYLIPGPVGPYSGSTDQKINSYNESGLIMNQDHPWKPGGSSDWSRTTNDFKIMQYETDSKAAAIFTAGNMDGTNYFWDWKNNFLGNIKNTESFEQESPVLGNFPISVGTTNIDYDGIVDNIDQDGKITMKKNWMSNIWGLGSVIGSDVGTHFDTANQFKDKCGFGGQNGLWKQIIPYEHSATVWDGINYYGGSFVGYHPEDANHSWANILNYNVKQLLETDWIGYDKDHDNGDGTFGAYYTTTDLNKDISKALLGIYYQKQFIENVFNKDFSQLDTDKWASKDVTLDLSKCFYWNSVLNSHDMAGGLWTWMGYDKESGTTAIPENQWGSYREIVKGMYTILVDLVNKILSAPDGENNIFLTFQNYFNFKDYVNNYVIQQIKAGKTSPGEVFPFSQEKIVKRELMSGYPEKEGEEKPYQPHCYDSSNPFTYALNEEYNFIKHSDEGVVDWNISLNNLKTLILILPQLKLQQWSMECRYNDQANDVTFINADQNPNVGKNETDYIMWSSGLEILEPFYNASNLHYIDKGYSPTDDTDMLIATNFQTTNTLSTNCSDSDTTEPDAEGVGKHKEGSHVNIDRLSSLTNNAIGLGPDGNGVFYVDTKTNARHNMKNTIRVKKDAKCIYSADEAEKGGMPFHVEVKESCLAHQADWTWNKALADNNNDVIAALKDIYLCQDKETKVVTKALPFAEFNLFDSDLKYNFDLTSLGKSKYLKVVPNGTLGTLTTYIMQKEDPEAQPSEDDQVVASFTSKGFTTKNPEPEPTPSPTPEGGGTNIGAIIGGTIGGVVAAAAIVAGSVIGVKRHNLKKKEKDFDAKVKEGA